MVVPAQAVIRTVPLQYETIQLALDDSREGDIILGNVVGSNVFNVLAVLGVTSLVVPLPIAFAEVRIDLLVMVLFSVMLLPIVQRNHRVSRRSGGVLLLGYVLYTAALYIF